jgi:dTDP-4-amino-4,6-dideoxygalactose transaminase
MQELGLERNTLPEGDAVASEVLSLPFSPYLLISEQRAVAMELIEVVRASLKSE